MTVITGTVSPTSDQIVEMYLKADMLDMTSATPVSVRLEACDNLIGYPQVREGVWGC